MRHSEKFREYIWLVNTIVRHGSITLGEINEQWVECEMSGGLPFSRSTFLRHKDAIEEMFGLYIECDTHNGYRYYIGNEHVLQENSVQNWLLSTLSVSSLVADCLGMQHRILLERASADHWQMERLVRAMKTGRRIDLRYRRYQTAEARHYTLEPYCLKLFAQRWYLMGRRTSGQLSIFAFDRMEDITLLGEKFAIDEYFDAESYFSECYGVVIGDGTQPQHIELRAFGREQFAMRDLPLHHTQRIVRQTDEHTDFALDLRPTSDFKAHLLSRGRWLKVLRPAALAAEIRGLHREAMEMYD